MKRNRMWTGCILALSLALTGASCGSTKDKLEESLNSKVTGVVMNAKGAPVEGATIKLFDLTQNTDFVVGGDIQSGTGLIDPEKVAAGTNTVVTATTDANGAFSIENVTAAAFLATASKENCSIDFQGFDDETGILSSDTLIKPDFAGGSLSFTIPEFTIACSDPPAEVNDDGSSTETTVPEPQPEPECDATVCEAAGGACDGSTCVIEAPDCDPTACAASQGVCVQKDCIPLVCSETIACPEGQLCVNPGTAESSCVPPICAETVACPENQLCVNPGTLEAVCVDIVCSDTIACAEGKLCQDGGTLHAACVDPLCSETIACAEGKLCKDGGTLDAACVDPVCSETLLCSDDLLCQNPGTLDAFCTKPVCVDDEDCAEAEFCVSGNTLEAACQKAICSDSETTPIPCPEPWVCFAADEPRMAHCGPVVCSTNEECGTGGTCLNPGTAQAVCQAPACTQNSDCGEGLVCVNPNTQAAHCIAPFCTTTEDCWTRFGVPDFYCKDGGTEIAECLAARCTETRGCPEWGFCADPGTEFATCLMPQCAPEIPCPENQVCENAGSPHAFCRPVECSETVACPAHAFCQIAENAIDNHCFPVMCDAEILCPEGMGCLNADTPNLAHCVPVRCTETAGCGADFVCQIEANPWENECVPVRCSATLPCPNNLLCQNPGTREAYCLRAACLTDDDCAAGQPGAKCVNPGLADAACVAPDPNELIVPETPAGWTLFKVTTSPASGTPEDLTDASAGSTIIPSASMGENTIIRVYGEYSGSATTAYLMVQTGAVACGEGFEPKLDYIEIPIANGKINGGKGDYIEVYWPGIFMKMQLTTSAINGEGESSAVVQIGEDCVAPAVPFTVTLSWEIGAESRADLDLHVWNAAGEQCYYGKKALAWGNLNLDDRRGPGPEVFTVTDPTAGPFVVKVRYFSGSQKPVNVKVRIMGWDGTQFVDNSFEFPLGNPRDIMEVGVFSITPEAAE